MSLLTQFVDLFLHLDKHLDAILQAYGHLTYAILFLIVFCETGLVVTPFLPGDSLLFAAGTFAAKGSLSLTFLLVLFSVASILGDFVNYMIGWNVGEAIYKRNLRFIRKEHLDKAHAFYERHGGKAIVIARFLPIFRTFVPFVAGVGKMDFSRFAMFNVFGGLLWGFGFTLLGYAFGNVPFVEKNFSIAILAIVAVSFIPAVVHWLQSRRPARAADHVPGGPSAS